MAVNIQELQQQRRWVLWRFIMKPGKDKLDKVPFQRDGRMARTNDPSTWSTYAECETVVSRFDGIGLVLGDVDGVAVWGVDIDGCCDALTGKFSAQSREVVIGLDSYGEYSPSGTGCHVFGLGRLPGDGKPIVRPFPGCKQIEIKGRGYYFTVTARHLSKTPKDLMDRQSEITALCERVQAASRSNLTVTMPQDEEERFRKLWAGDTSDYDGNASRADLALCCMLAHRLHNDVFKIDDEFRKSGLYREKWERSDYRSLTILKAIKGEPILDGSDCEPIGDDGPTEFLVEAKNETGYEGWFPLGEVSLVGGSSGVGKTSLLIPLLERMRSGSEVFGHATKPREYRVLLHDRSRKAMRRTAKALNLSQNVIERVIRLTPAQQKQPAAEVLQTLVTSNPGAEAWLIEGLDMWVKNVNDLEAVSELIDSLQRVAIRHNIAVLATLGSAKQKQGERYLQHRDSLFGSIAFGRKAETVLLMELHNPENPDSVRRCTILTRCGKSEQYYFEFRANEGLCMTEKPEAVAVRKESAFTKIEDAVFSAFKPGDVIEYQPAFGKRTTFYDWRKSAIADGKVVLADTKIYVPFVRAGDTCPLCKWAAPQIQ